MDKSLDYSPLKTKIFDNFIIKLCFIGLLLFSSLIVKLMNLQLLIYSFEYLLIAN